ncbi:MAG: dienelactone hydrolase, partial [Verrucomicrobiales bacterium]
MKWIFVIIGLMGLACFESVAQNYAGIPTEPKHGDRLLSDYFALQTKELTQGCLVEIDTAADWQQAREQYRTRLFEMLGLHPLPKRTPLNSKVTGSQRHEGVVIENVVFESMPGLYVTGNFYRPAAEGNQPLPAILYVCGHSPQKEAGISFGNKTAYHHHGLWFAKNGYACLMIDTIQLGEIEGIHHGTYREGRWWWNARGYSSAGVEAWNGMRALDYMATRTEVDQDRIGITGRSGGGAYSWWISALDERVKVAVPVAGIASLHNHVVDGTVEGHCDCMFHVNTYRWDFPAIAALVAPRPLLIANTDKDNIFPLDGVVDVYTKTRRIYKLLGAENNIGLAISEGPHKDTQPLRTEAFHWFERHLKGRAPGDEIDTVAPKALDRTTMRALDAIPQDEIVTKIDESFVRVAPVPELPADAAAWGESRDAWMTHLREKCFRGWPDEGGDLRLKEIGREVFDGTVELVRYEFDSQVPFRLPLVVAIPTDFESEHPSLTLLPVDRDEWQKLSADKFKGLRAYAESGSAVALFAPRGVGPTAWTEDARERVHIRRRFMLLGQTLDGMRVWDIRRAIAAVRAIEATKGLRLEIEADG